jgi:hypothetical protein
MKPSMLPIWLALLVLSSSAWCRSEKTPAEEFVGPFPSCKNAKTDFGGAGHGKAENCLRAARCSKR